MNKEPRLIAGSHGGLCNRLRVMLSGQQLAKESGRRFLLFWPANAECGCPFNRLFNDPIPIASPEHVQELQPKYLSRYWVGAGSWKAGQTTDLLTLPDQDILVFSYTWLLFSGRFPRHGLLLNRAYQALDRLQPIDTIRTSIETFKSQHFTPKTIGVHIRRGDFWQYTKGKLAPLERFIQEIDKAVDEHPDSAVFVSSDDGAPVNHASGEVIYEGILSKLSARYGHRIVTSRPSSLIRSKPEAVQDALVDLLLLRLTQRFIGTSGSTFSGLAIVGRKTPHVLLSGTVPIGKVAALSRAVRFRPVVRRHFRKVGPSS